MKNRNIVFPGYLAILVKDGTMDFRTMRKPANLSPVGGGLMGFSIQTK